MYSRSFSATRSHVFALLQLVKMAAASPDGSLPPLVRARLAMLGQQWPVAESLLLAQGQVDDVIAAYQECHRCVGGDMGLLAG
jgi:hypothetical protein